VKSGVLSHNGVELAEFDLNFRIFIILFFIRHSRDHLVFSLKLIFAILLFLEPYFHYFFLNIFMPTLEFHSKSKKGTERAAGF